MRKYIDADKLIAEIRKHLIPTVLDRDYDEWEHGRDSGFIEAISIIASLQQEQPKPSGYDKALLEVKSKVDELYEEASIGLSEYDSGLYNGIAETCMKLRGFIKARLDSDEQPEVDYNKFEKLFDDFCERNKGHHITFHDACMWFWKLGLNARKK